MSEKEKPGAAPSTNTFLREILGPWKDPPAILIAGDSGTGKTISLLKAFAGAVVLQLPGASRGWNRVLGLPSDMLRTMEVTSIRDARARVQRLRARNEAILGGKRQGDIIWAVIPDDITLLAAAEMRILRTEIPRADNFWFHEQLKAAIEGFAYACRFAGMVLSTNAHLKRPDEKGKGGPQMPVQTLVPALPHIFDTSVIALADDDSRRPWSTVLHNYPPGGLYFCKDRHNIVQETSPLNIRELLSHVGYRLPRHPGLEWQERAVEEIAGKIEQETKAGKSVAAAFAEIWAGRMAQLQEKAKSPEQVLHWRWALEDGRDRYEIREAAKSALFGL